MTDPVLNTRVRSWLDSLAELTRRGEHPVEAEQIDLMARALVTGEFPSAAFCQRSLHHVAGNHRYFPSYAEVRDDLRGWWNVHRPTIAPALEAPNLAHLTAEERAWVAFYGKRRAAILEPGYVADRGSAAADLHNLASLLRQYSPRAWRYVSGHDGAEVQSGVDTASRTRVSEAVQEALSFLDGGQGQENVPPTFSSRGLSADDLHTLRKRRGVVR